MQLSRRGSSGCGGGVEHRYSYPYGLMVDINGKRFVDEGEDFFSYTYAKCGREILRLPWRTAYQIFDSKTRPLLRWSTTAALMSPPIPSKRWQRSCPALTGKTWSKQSMILTAR